MAIADARAKAGTDVKAEHFGINLRGR